MAPAPQQADAPPESESIETPAAEAVSGSPEAGAASSEPPAAAAPVATVNGHPPDDVADNTPNPEIPPVEIPLGSGDSSTEVRSQVRSQGGVKYEVIISQASKEQPQLSSPPSRTVSAEDIQSKLEAAHMRRISIGEGRMNQLAEKMNRIRENVTKRDEEHKVFIRQTLANLESKQSTFTGNRETYLQEMRARLREHSKTVAEVREKMNAQTNEVRLAIEEKIRVATENRDENYKKMLDKLREHEEYCRKIRSSSDKDMAQLEANIQEKLLLAKQKREELLEKKLEPARETSDRLAQAQKAREKATTEAVTEIREKLETKLTLAEQKRQQEIEKKIEKGREHDRHVEIVRKRQEELAKSGEMTKPMSEDLTSSSG